MLMNLLNKILAASILCVSPALAQKLVPIKVDSSSSVTVAYTDANGLPAQRVKYDVDGDGLIEVTVPSHVTSVRITKASDGEVITYDQRV
jgi:hypothetical protein